MWLSGAPGHWSQTPRNKGWARGLVIERGRSRYQVRELPGVFWLLVGADFSSLSSTGGSPGEWEGRDRVPPVFTALEDRKAWCVAGAEFPRRLFPTGRGPGLLRVRGPWGRLLAC